VAKGTGINPASARRAVARKLAMQALYRWQINSSPWQDVLSEFASDEDMRKADRGYFNKLVTDICGGSEALDGALAAWMDRKPTELDPVVQINDILHVDRAPQIYVYGEVQRPGVSRLERGMTVMQALAQSGGLTQRGTERGLRIHRRDASGAVKIIQPNMNDLVERDDVIYVRESLF